MFARRSLALAVLIAAVLGFAGIFQHELWTPDEPREAEIGREMLVSGFSALPTLGGEPFVEKPPFFPWAIAASYEGFGVSAGAARIPAALFGIGAVLVAYALGRRAGGRTAGLASAIVLATTAKFAEISHASVNDIALTFFVGCGHLAILAARDRRGASAYLAVGLAAGLAFLTKAWIGPILIAGPALLAAIAGRERDFLRRATLPVAASIAGGVVLFGLPWVLALERTAGWEPVRVCLVDNLLGRAVGASGSAAFGHARGPLYYLAAAPLAFLPWTLALPAAVSARIHGHAGRGRFLALVALAGLVLLSIPLGKRDLYLLPLFPAASVLPGVWLSRAGARKLDRASFATLVLLPALALVAAGAVLLAVAAGTLVRAGPLSDPIWREKLLMISAMLVGAGLGVAWLARKSLRGALVAGVLVLFVLLFHAGLRPLIDPLKNLKPGALEIARAIPESEPILAFAPDETTRAVVPFYSGRILTETRSPETARHLVVIDTAEKKLPEDARRGLRAIASVELGMTRRATVYRREDER